MTGLIWKDLCVMRKTLRYYLLLIVIYVILTALGFFSYSFVITFVQVILIILPLSAFAYDEQAKWDGYAMALPLGRSAVVGARYFFLLTLILFTTALGLAGTALLYLLQKGDPLEMLLTLMVSTTIGILVPSILLPLSYKLGAEQARVYLFAIIFLPIIALVLLVKAGVLDMSILNGMNVFSPFTLTAITALLPLGALVLLFVSYLISCRIAAGKEY